MSEADEDPVTALARLQAFLEERAKGGAVQPARFVTDPDAPAGSEEAELHKARMDLEAHRGKSATATGPRVRFTSAAEMLGQTFAKTPWLVQGVLPADGVHTVAGEPKTSKTWAAMEMALGIATGTRSFGHFSPGLHAPAPVALFLVEDAPRSVRARLVGLSRGRGMEPAAALKLVYVHCRGALDLQVDQDLCWVIAACRRIPGGKPALLVLDPLRDLHHAEEDKSGPMSEVMGNLRALRDILGCSVLFVHHASKATRDNNSRRPGQRMRGSSAIHGSVDGGLYLTQKDTQEGTVFINQAEVELKAAKGAGRFVLRLELEDDAEGEVQVARWIYEHEEIVVPADTVEHLLFLLRQDWVGNPASPVPRSQNFIRERLRKGAGVAREAIQKAESSGRIRTVMQGQKSLGFVYVPTADDAAQPNGGTP